MIPFLGILAYARRYLRRRAGKLTDRWADNSTPVPIQLYVDIRRTMRYRNIIVMMWSKQTFSW